MAYNLESFRQILGQEQYHLILDCRIQIENLQQQTHFLTIDHHENLPVAERQVLDVRIRNVVQIAENLIEWHIKQVRSEDQAHQLDLTSVLVEFDSIRQRMSAVRPLVDLPHPAYNLEEPNNTVVGFDEDLSGLLDRLTGEEPKLQIIPIVGMGGIGKTTLARLIYNHVLVDDRFDFRAWVTISHQFNARHTFLSILRSLNMLTGDMHKENEYKLRDHVYQNLKSRRYFIVVDDIWNTEAWDTLRLFFPNDDNGSRILLTTRDGNVANYANPLGNNVHQMHSLIEDDSWNLFCENVFGQESCPPELEPTGRKISNNCEGHPLAIVVAGLLMKSDMTSQFWESVNKNFRSIVTRLDLQCLEMLSMSYELLPCYLKPCFLYVGSFPEDNQIRASKIIKLWVAEGIVKPSGDNTSEDVAEEYLNDLIGRNLLSACKQNANGKVRTFKIHHLFRELCQRKAVEEKFLWFRNSDDSEIRDEEKVMRCVSVSPVYQAINGMPHMSLNQSFSCFGFTPSDLAPLFFDSRLLRVLDVFQIEFVHFPVEIEKFMNLRYLSLCLGSPLPSSVFTFQNLQTLIICLPLLATFSLPSHLWEMTQLKHIQFKKTLIQYRPENEQNVVGDCFYLKTLSNVKTSNIAKLLQRTPNLKKLGIYCDSPVHSAIDLALLDRLERLKCSSVRSPVIFLSNLILPHFLKKLTLSFCKIPSRFMMYVGSLLNLEQLKLKNSDFVITEGESMGTTGSEWAPVVGGFMKLISLTMENLSLMHWRTESSHFPMLQNLTICGCASLMEIPSDVGFIETLERIEVAEFSSQVRDSALKIQEEQEEYGSPLQVNFGHAR